MLWRAVAVYGLCIATALPAVVVNIKRHVTLQHQFVRIEHQSKWDNRDWTNNGWQHIVDFFFFFNPLV